MLKIGAMQIDTSHPLAFGQYLMNDTRGRYYSVFNDSFRNDAEVEGFISRYGLQGRAATLEELAEQCDIGFIHGCDWDDHLRCALPFIQRRKPVFIDKPLVGNIRDLNRLTALVEEGAVVYGASSARYALEIRDYLAEPEEERGHIFHVHGTCGVDEFNYGIHIIEAIGALMGDGAVSVRFAGRGQSSGMTLDDYVITYGDGRTASYTLMTGKWQPFTLTVMTDKTTRLLPIDSNRLYAALLDEVLNAATGRENRLAGMESLAESVKIALAGRLSRQNGGGAVCLNEIPQDDPGYDGKAFCKGYAAASGPMYAR